MEQKQHGHQLNYIQVLSRAVPEEQPRRLEIQALSMIKSIVRSSTIHTAFIARLSEICATPMRKTSPKNPTYVD
eukprot:6188791-Pleurochrysis_carterae.AAC.2